MAFTKKSPLGDLVFGPLALSEESACGTFETCRPALRMSGAGGRPEARFLRHNINTQHVVMSSLLTIITIFSVTPLKSKKVKKVRRPSMFRKLLITTALALPLA
jgi:hypothetical protein